ncbi:MAG: rhodanese-like domain-containing protein [Thermoflexales bacterium]|nr:rhodanese-like domain-containing protein [Thermoflexales bacterium]MCX7939455.1 rhodanese-like domain-containing protein [Thermoflexales bacterium]MDW8293045.1 rhodanese-like domain-containing protein [Anaerolineae bacterium]
MKIAMFQFLKRFGFSNNVLTPQQYQQEFKLANRPHVLIDVRTPEEFRMGHIPGAKNIDVQVIGQRLKDIPQDKPVVLYCRSGSRSAIAASILRSAGYTEVYDLGGIGDWQAAGFPIER